MERIFQDQNGEIEELKGAQFSTVKAMVDDEDSSVVLLWCYDIVSNFWYRIFIDGTYCGVDRYREDNSGNDDDDGVSWSKHSEWFAGKKLLSAQVRFTGRTDDDIILTLRCQNDEFKLICKFEVGQCHLEFD